MKKNCTFWEQGQCKKGDNCTFSHAITGNMGNPSPPAYNKPNTNSQSNFSNNRKVCNFFAQGNCKKGNNCEFLHEGGDNSQSTYVPNINKQNFNSNSNSNTNTNSNTNSNSNICQFFLKGYCKNESNCK